MRYSILSLQCIPSSFLPCCGLSKRHTRCCNRLVNDARAGRSPRQMLDSGSLAVTRGTHILTHRLVGVSTRTVRGMAEFTAPPHLSLPRHAVLPARFLFFLPRSRWLSLVLSAQFTRGSRSGFYALLLFGFTALVDARHWINQRFLKLGIKSALINIVLVEPMWKCCVCSNGGITWGGNAELFDCSVATCYICSLF